MNKIKRFSLLVKFGHLGIECNLTGVFIPLDFAFIQWVRARLTRLLNQPANSYAIRSGNFRILVNKNNGADLMTLVLENVQTYVLALTPEESNQLQAMLDSIIKNFDRYQLRLSEEMDQVQIEINPSYNEREDLERWAD